MRYEIFNPVTGVVLSEACTAAAAWGRIRRLGCKTPLDVRPKGLRLVK